MIELFDTYFVDGQEQTGMHLAGQFRDLPARAEALNSFYYGPIWRAHSAAANAMMIDSDNALLLKPVRLGAGYPALDAPRPDGTGHSVIAGAVHHRGAADDGFVEYFADHVVPVLTATGAEPVAVFESLVAENNFPQLPLRDEVVLAWFARFPGAAAYDEHRWQLAASRVWREEVLPERVCRSAKPMQELRLSPTARSQLR